MKYFSRMHPPPIVKKRDLRKHREGGGESFFNFQTHFHDWKQRRSVRASTHPLSQKIGVLLSCGQIKKIKKITTPFSQTLMSRLRGYYNTYLRPYYP